MMCSHFLRVLSSKVGWYARGCNHLLVWWIRSGALERCCSWPRYRRRPGIPGVIWSSRCCFRNSQSVLSFATCFHGFSFGIEDIEDPSLATPAGIWTPVYCCNVQIVAIAKFPTARVGGSLEHPNILSVHHGILPSSVGFYDFAWHGFLWSHISSVTCRTCAAKQQLVAPRGVLLWSSWRSTSCKTQHQHSLGRSRTTSCVSSGVPCSIWWSGRQMGCGQPRLGHFQLRAKTCNLHWSHVAVRLWARWYSTRSRDSFCNPYPPEDCHKRLALCFACVWQCGSRPLEIECGSRAWCTVHFCRQGELWQQQLSGDACKLVATCSGRPFVLGLAFCCCHCQCQFQHCCDGLLPAEMAKWHQTPLRFAKCSRLEWCGDWKAMREAWRRDHRRPDQFHTECHLQCERAQRGLKTLGWMNMNDAHLSQVFCNATAMHGILQLKVKKPCFRHFSAIFQEKCELYLAILCIG